ncbi:cryptochrome/photolyase family protein [Leucobacter salsicius]|uniref:cryptochrome/photolyase family protein n=1 Tax=Leucobacter salsicius TaxID=664638 RepID=UPI000347F4F0|nr:deoxyribodipyrimidine photo-lyase [Leucobacter salsicius]
MSDAAPHSTVVCFRDDLRIADHPALAAAAEQGPVICLFVLDEVSSGVRPLGGAAKWWLHHSLTELAAALEQLGVPLVLRRGAAQDIVPQVVAESRATQVVWNRRYGGAERDIDARLKASLRATGVAAHSYRGGLLHEPWTIATESGTPYRVYSAFWRQLLRLPSPVAPAAAPQVLVRSDRTPANDALAAWGLLPEGPDWAGGLRARWTPGEAHAHARLAAFLAGPAEFYDAARDQLGVQGTSELSPHLRWGEISPRQVWHAAIDSGQPVGSFLSEIGWREFAWHTLYHHPDLHLESLDGRFDPHAWALRPESEHAALLTAWQRGETGFTVVDAGMRELWHSGTMHNRARMITASLLTKNLGIDWREGEAWFWDTLVDADQASNPFNWQWVAGCGLDAAPYFRIFNPELQAKKFDANGEYQRTWATDAMATPPIVDLRASRIDALARFDAVKAATRPQC